MYIYIYIYKYIYISIQKFTTKALCFATFSHHLHSTAGIPVHRLCHRNSDPSLPRDVGWYTWGNCQRPANEFSRTPWKFNSLPLKISRAPKGKDHLPTIIFAGAMLNFGDVTEAFGKKCLLALEKKQPTKRPVASLTSSMGKSGCWISKQKPQPTRWELKSTIGWEQVVLESTPTSRKSVTWMGKAPDL